MSKKGQEIPQGQPQDVIGGGLIAGVVDQLIAREKLISTTRKDNNQLLFFNGNGAWARLVSSVNTLDKTETTGLADGTKTIKDVVGTSYLANHNVLMGGSLKQGTPDNPTSLKGGVNENLHNPVKIDSEGYISAGDINNSAYNKYGSLGFRPTPGIESVSVQSKGTYGTLRVAEVKVKVWTLEDLEVMQALYLRPGYTILLEWGHSLQLDSQEGTVNKDIQFYRKFMQNKVPFKTIETDLNELRQDSGYNYDSMFGYVSNFTWSFNADGGYDCTVKIISKGTVLESIAVTFDPSNVYPAAELSVSEGDKGKKERRSIYHKLFVELEGLIGDQTDASIAAVETSQAYALGAFSLLSGPVASPELAIAYAGQVLQEEAKVLFGDPAIAKSLAEDIASANGRALAADPVFAAKIEKIRSGGSTNYRGTEYTWTAVDGEKPFAKLQEEEAVDYLNREFGMYGLKFEESGVGDAMIIQATHDPSLPVGDIDLDPFSLPGSRVETFNIIDYITENGKLPGS